MSNLSASGRAVRVVRANGLKGEARAGVVYVGRAWAGWPASKFGNHSRLGCPDEFRAGVLANPNRDALLDELWELTGSGGRPLACWRLAWDGVTLPVPGCHAAVWAELVNRRRGFITAPTLDPRLKPDRVASEFTAAVADLAARTNRPTDQETVRFLAMISDWSSRRGF